MHKINVGLQQDVEVRYRTRDIPHIRRKYKPGMRIRVIKEADDGSIKSSRILTATEVYKHHLSCIDIYGRRESFEYIELEQAGQIL